MRLRFSAKKDTDGLLADKSQQARGGDSKKVSNACYQPLEPNEKLKLKLFRGYIIKPQTKFNKNHAYTVV